MSGYVYLHIWIESCSCDDGNCLWRVGFYDPDGRFITESDHSDREEAAKRVAWLNGGAR